MQLPVMPPVKPMLAKSVAAVPDGAHAYEPEWDGFLRDTVVFSILDNGRPAVRAGLRHRLAGR